MPFETRDIWREARWQRPPDERADGPEAELRIVRADGIDALLRFQDRVFGELPDKRFVYYHERSYFEALLAGAGTVVGAFTQDGVVGFSACEFHLPAAKVAELCPFVAPAERNRVAINGTTLIDQHHRSRGLGRRLHTERLRLVQERGCLHAIGITFLTNHRSLALAFGMGRLVKGTLVDQDGPNLLSHLDLCRNPVRRSSPNRTVELADFDAHRAAIAAGLWGYALQGDQDRRSMLYAACDHEQ